MHKSIRTGEFKLHYRCEDPLITHLFFIDDLIAFMGGDTGTMGVFMDNLKTFTNCSRLEVNFNKSHIFLLCYKHMDNGNKFSRLCNLILGSYP